MYWKSPYQLRLKDQSFNVTFCITSIKMIAAMNFSIGIFRSFVEQALVQALYTTSTVHSCSCVPCVTLYLYLCFEECNSVCAVTTKQWGIKFRTGPRCSSELRTMAGQIRGAERLLWTLPLTLSRRRSASIFRSVCDEFQTRLSESLEVNFLQM